MATRVNRKNASTASPKEVVAAEKAVKPEVTADTAKPSNAGTKTGGKSTPIGKRLAKKGAKKLIGKTRIAVKLKAKAKKPRKLTKQLAKSLLKNPNGLETKKKLLKNGVKEGKAGKRKVIKKEKDDKPPVLEPIFPIEENTETKKQPKKKAKKTVDAASDLPDVKKIKKEEDDMSFSSDVTDISNAELPNLKKQVRKRGAKKAKIENETIEDVMNDLSFLIKKEEVKTEVDTISESGKSDILKPKRLTKKQKLELLKQANSLNDVMDDLAGTIKQEEIKSEFDSASESSKSDTIKCKKPTKRQKVDLLKRKMIKKENIENTLNKLDELDEKVIDMLDLNVSNVGRKKSLLTKRRHSIEKFPISSLEVENPMSNLFNHLPRSISPKLKRTTKLRQSVDGASRRSSSYSTRSDSPMRILRNGKQRKLKDMNLLEGLNPEIRKRRRLCSEIVSGELLKSGYDSDSSFSDLASSHGAENSDIDTVAKTAVPKEVSDKTNTVSTAQNGPISDLDIVDTNSNVCNNLNDKNDFVPIPEILSFETGTSNILEKSALLDIMKQAFNETNKDSTTKPIEEEVPKDFETVLTTTFYGKERSNSVEENSAKESLTMQDSPFETSAGASPETRTTAALDLQVEAAIGIIEQNIAETDVAAEETNIFFEPKTPEEIIPHEPPVTTDESEVSVKENIENPPEATSVEASENSAKEEMEIDELPAPTLEKLESIPEQLEPEEHPPQLEASEYFTNEVAPAASPEENNVLESESKSVGDNSEVSVTECKLVTGEEFHGETDAAFAAEMNNPSLSDSNEENSNSNVEESAEELAEKESILKALGLQSLKAAEEYKHKTTTSSKSKSSKGDIYTGTLKTVIKLNRDKKKHSRSGLKMTLQKSKVKGVDEEHATEEENYKIAKDTSSSSWKQGTQSSDTAGAHRKTHYSNRSNLDGSSEHTSDGEVNSQDGAIKALVIPEKASSFSIHPGRLCKDECSYCFGKFGLFDTPCHIAQMKSVERQDKILATEKHLTRDSCLCDACYRHVDRKSNTPSYMNKSLKRNSIVAPGPRQNHCHVLGCNRVSTNILRRKWMIKMRKSICQVINLDLDNPGLHSIPICDEHYSALEHLMICAMCKRRLARNHIHYLGPEVTELNNALCAEDIPLSLTDKPVVCKLCKYFASIILKDPEERPDTSVNFFRDYKRRLLHFNDIVPMDEAAAEEPIAVPSKSERLDEMKKKKKLGKSSSSTNEDSQESGEGPEKILERVPSTDTNSRSQSRSESPSDDYNGVDYNTLIPAIAMDCDSDGEKKEGRKPSMIIKKIHSGEGIPDSVEISRIIRNHSDKNKSDLAVQKLGSNPSISVRQLFPGEEDLPLNVHVDFNNVKDRMPEGWEKCATVIQYDAETKRLWQELQKPYGNQSSFLRHLILLEKYFRNGDLMLSPRASHHSINYSESVHNRLRAYDNIPSSAGNIQPLSMIPFNKMPSRSSSGIVTGASSISLNPLSTNTQPTTITAVPSSKIPYCNSITITSQANTITPKNTAPLTISQLSSPPLIPASKNHLLENKIITDPNVLIRPKVGAPPGLISLHPGMARSVAPLVRVPQSQKIKFPITKNWRPNLIPIDPSKKQERKAGLVQVISGGKPYHITLEDYKKMCAIKRSFEMKQKRLQEAQNVKPILVTHNSVLKSIIPRKGLIISQRMSPAKTEGHQLLNNSNGDGENILDKLDKQVEKLESKLKEKSASLLLPKIPKSLTVIPQTVMKKSSSRPSSPVLQITPKSNISKS